MICLRGGCRRCSDGVGGGRRAGRWASGEYDTYEVCFTTDSFQYSISSRDRLVTFERLGSRNPFAQNAHISIGHAMPTTHVQIACQHAMRH